MDQHLNGCLIAYQTDPSYGAAVYFGLEALWGIARDIAIRAKSGEFDQNQLHGEWIIDPRMTLPVPWIWIRALGTAWERYKTEGGPLGHTFGQRNGPGARPH